ncbi:MAG TPA: tripartite tricarboxylate transporter substrate binding protein [Burkholderiales bacterium]|nr:tripartite tricarboxylate transporter substrate binding protein [Burkholderiales bacterium]
MKALLVLAAFAVGTALNAGAALAQSYPSKPIRIIVPVPPGGATDTMTRHLADQLSPRLGQPLIVENRPGAGGTVGAGFVAKQDPDGYTMLMGFTGTIAIAGSLYKSLPFDPLKDLEPVSMIVLNPLVLVTREGLPAKDVKGYVALAKQKANGMTYGSPGKGSSIHLTGEIFARATGTQLLHVPYKGSGPAMQDLYGGRLDSIFGDLMQLMPVIQSGKVNAIAVTSRKRNPLLPKLPTIAESGYPDFEVISWHGLFVPAGTPAEIVAKLYREVSATLKGPAMTKFLTERGGEIVDLPPAEAKQFVQKEAARWAGRVKEVGFTHD